MVLTNLKDFFKVKNCFKFRDPEAMRTYIHTYIQCFFTSVEPLKANTVLLIFAPPALLLCFTPNRGNIGLLFFFFSQVQNSQQIIFVLKEITSVKQKNLRLAAAVFSF